MGQAQHTNNQRLRAKAHRWAPRVAFGLIYVLGFISSAFLCILAHLIFS